MTKQEWGACMALITTYWPHQFKLDHDPRDEKAKARVKAKIDALYMPLAHLPGDRIKAAIIHMAATQSAFPSVADIARHAGGEPLDWSSAWAEVMRLVGSEGYYGSPQFSSPVIEEAVAALGGWQFICQSPTKDHPTMRAQFRQAIEAATERQSRRDTFERLGVPPEPKQLQAPKSLQDILKQLPVPERAPGEEETP